MTSIGTLFAFVVVSLAVIILRVKRPEAARPFRVPFGLVFPVLGVVSCLYLMVSLSVMTWVRFLGWLDIGMVIYWFYGRTHSPLADQRGSRPRGSAVENLANFLKVAGYLLLFNGFCITLLAFLTIGRHDRGAGQVGELDALLTHIGGTINPEIADAFGLKILALGAVVTVAGPCSERGKK